MLLLFYHRPKTDTALASISHTHGVGGGRVLRRLPHTCEAGSVPVA